jgi:hypothetical protein
MYGGFSTAGGQRAPYIGGELGLGYEWRRARFGWESAFGFGPTGKGGFHFTTTLSAAFFLIDGSWSPYIGLGAGYALISPHWQAAMGFAAEPRIGVELLRNRTARLYLLAACTLPAFIGDFNTQGGEYHTYLPVYRFGAGAVF